MRRSRKRGRVGSFLLAAVICLGSLAWLVYSFRWVDVACRRAEEAVACSLVERLGTYELWSAEADDVRIVRAMSGTSGGPAGVVAETQAGALVPLSSTVLGTDQHDAIAARIHQWIFVDRDEPALVFTQGPSLANAVMGGGIALLAALWGLTSLFGFLRSLAPPRPPAAPRGQRLSI